MLRAIQTHTVRAQNTAIIISTVCNICSKYDDIKSNYHLLNMNVMRGENTTKSRSVSEGLGWKPIFISFQYFTSVIVLHAGMICRNIFHGVQCFYNMGLFTWLNFYLFLISEPYLVFLLTVLIYLKYFYTNDTYNRYIICSTWYRPDLRSSYAINYVYNYNRCN